MRYRIPPILIEELLVYGINRVRPYESIIFKILYMLNIMQTLMD